MIQKRLIHRKTNQPTKSFPKIISPKVNVIARVEFELAYYDVVVQHISHHVMGHHSHALHFQITYNPGPISQYNMKLLGWWKKHSGFIEQVLAATPHKVPTIQPTASHHENYQS